jgi:hypothetical protein
MILPRLRAAAGPAQLPDEDDPSPDTQLEDQDPLRTVLEYMVTVSCLSLVLCAH